MYTLIISIILGCTTSTIYYFINKQSEYVSSLYVYCIIAVIATIIFQLIIGFIIRKKTSKMSDKIQSIISDGQDNLNRKIQQLQQKPIGNQKTMQKIIENDRDDIIRNALSCTKQFDWLCKWSFLLKKQLNTIRMQFHYCLREFNKVDELLSSCMYMDANTVAMYMARKYIHNNNLECEKAFKKGIRKFKKNDGIIIYATYSWILIKQNKIKEAISVLTKGKTNTSDSTIMSNWEYLINGGVNRFSNNGIGDQWYSLYLEEPKIAKPTQKYKFMKK